MWVVVLEMFGKDVTALFVELLHRSDPVALPVRVIAAPRTLYDAKVLSDQLVGAEVIFFHVGFTVGIMLGEVSATYHPAMVATDTADNKCEAIVAIETLFERSHLAHQSAPSFTVIGERCKEASVLAWIGLRLRSVQSCDVSYGFVVQLIGYESTCSMQVYW